MLELSLSVQYCCRNMDMNLIPIRLFIFIYTVIMQARSSVSSQNKKKNLEELGKLIDFLTEIALIAETLTQAKEPIESKMPGYSWNR